MIRVDTKAVELLITPADTSARIGQFVTEILVSEPIRAFNQLTGVGVSQFLIELLFSVDSPKVRVGDEAIEVLISPNDARVIQVPLPSGCLPSVIARLLHKME